MTPAREVAAPSAVDMDWTIELLRAVAATMVMLVHFMAARAPAPDAPTPWPLSFFFTGVDLFFVLTGYVFAPHLFAGVGHKGAYATRRLFRIYPLYGVAVLAYAGLSAWHGRPVSYLVDHLLFLQTTVSRDVAGYYNLAFWSLPPEVEYYVALPLLAWALRGRTSAALLLAAVALLLQLAISAQLPAAGQDTPRWLLVSVHLPGLLVEFMVGALAWKAVQREASRARALALVALGAALWLGLAALFAASEGPAAGTAAALGRWLQGRFGVVAALCFGLLVCGAVALGRLRMGTAGWLRRTSVFAGSLSYGVYLLHNGVLSVLAPLRPALGEAGALALYGAATLALAYLASRLIEIPSRRFGKRLAARLAA